MIAVLTGDIINSRSVHSSEWLPSLKSYLEELTTHKTQWEIYRGDSFQLEVPSEKALEIGLTIKALVKINRKIDVRIAIGIGEKEVQGEKITESYGTAFVNSGESFENLKNNTLNIQTPFIEFDDYFSVILPLISVISDNWTSVVAETIFHSLKNRNALQKDIAQLLNKNNSSINKSLKRGSYNEIVAVIDLFAKKINQYA